MKLKKEFVTHNIADAQVMISTDIKRFSGLVRSNPTAAEIVDYLKTETSVEEIVQKMLAKYDASEEQILKDVEKIVSKLKSIGALDD